jgi:tRNA A37 threonylcarbamoyladenosine modification protein TsaB
MKNSQPVILIIDSVHAELTVALLVGDEAIVRAGKQQRTHDRSINTLVQEVIQQAELKFADIDCYAVVVGPGGWTGCRVGVTALKGYNAGVARNIIALTSLQVLGESAAVHSNRDNYFIENNGQFQCVELSEDKLKKYSTIAKVGMENYRARLLGLVRQKYDNKDFVNPAELSPLYITDFAIKA